MITKRKTDWKPRGLFFALVLFLAVPAVPAAHAATNDAEDQSIRYVRTLLESGKTRHALAEAKRLIKAGEKSKGLYLMAMIHAEDIDHLKKVSNIIGDLKAWDPESPYVAKLEHMMACRYLQFKIRNDVPELSTSGTVVDIKSEKPLVFVYRDETGKQDTIKVTPGAVCVNEECANLKSRVMRDRAEASAGRYRFVRDCREWTDYTRASVNEDAVDRRCMMTVIRMDLGL